jgi:uncharacterized protein YprB with RNaseH-like and TPR domain
MMRNKSWSERDVATLTERRASNVGYAKIGKELGRTDAAVQNKAFQMGLTRPQGVPWYTGLRIGFLDIETSNFDANAGNMLSWALKPRGKAVISDVIAADEAVDPTQFDHRIVMTLIEALRDVDVVVTYYGTGFDNPYLKTRALGLGLTPPSAYDLYHWDVYYAVKYKLKLHRNSLDAACEFFGIEGKSHLKLKVWNAARVGNQAALDYVLEHNVQDVKILERLFDIMEPLQKWSRKPF